MKTITFALGALTLVSQLAAAQPHRRHLHQHEKKDEVVVTVTDYVYADPSAAPDVIVFVNQFGSAVSTMTEGLLAYTPSVWSTSHGVVPATAVAQSTSAPVPTTTSSFTTSTVPTTTSSANSASITSSSSSSSSFTTSIVPTTTTTSSAIQAAVNNVEVLDVTSSASVESAKSVASVQSVASVASVESVKSVQSVASVASVKSASSAAAVAEAAVKTTTSAAAKTTSAASVATSTAASSGSSSGFGISYSPYNSDSSCKTAAQVLTDFETIGSAYPIIRTYGTDCNQVATIFPAVKKYGLKQFIGIYDLTTANLASQVALIVSAVDGDWDYVDTVSVGNEAVNDGTASPAAVIAAMSTVRSLLKTAGYTGPVVTVDTMAAMLANPTLCTSSDYCAANCHPFFDSGIAASGAGTFVTEQIALLKTAVSDSSKKIVITETGWPHTGSANGLAIPSVANQATALSSIKSAFASTPSNVILFTAFNDMWKTATAATFDAEPYWGTLGDCPSG